MIKTVIALYLVTGLAMAAPTSALAHRWGMRGVVRLALVGAAAVLLWPMLLHRLNEREVEQ